MKELDDILIFLFENSEDRRIHISKRMKYGYRYYYISLSIDIKDDDPLSEIMYKYNGGLHIIIDNRNVCFEIESSEDDRILIEDKNLVEKWSSILEDFLEKKAKGKVRNMLESTLKKCHKNDLFREYKMKKIFKDESL